jgi:hypothetical protein
MTKISLELDTALNKQLKRYVLDHFDDGHGKQQEVIRTALRAFLDADKGAAPAVECVVSSEEVPAAAKPVRKATRKSPITEDDQRKITEAWKAQDPGQRNISEVARQFPEYTDRQVRHFIEKNLKS